MDNETRERIEKAKDQAAKEWNTAFDYRALRNGVQVGNIKMHHLDGVNIRAMEIIAEHSRITELLKEKDERIDELWEVIEEMIEANFVMPRPPHPMYTVIGKAKELLLKGKQQ